MELFYLLDLFGTSAFAVSWALKAFKYKLDLLWVIVLWILTAVWWGTIREMLLWNTPPFIITDVNYLTVSVVTSCIAFILRTKLETRKKIFYFADAIGLWIFAVIWSQVALNAWLGIIWISLAWVLTAVWGGTIRDISVGEIPFIFRKELYAVSAIIWTIIFQVLLNFGLELFPTMIIASFVATSFRLASMRYNWHLPIAS